VAGSPGLTSVEPEIRPDVESVKPAGKAPLVIAKVAFGFEKTYWYEYGVCHLGAELLDVRVVPPVKVGVTTLKVVLACGAALKESSEGMSALIVHVPKARIRTLLSTTVQTLEVVLERVAFTERTGVAGL
jgi:hypothetical protein